MTKSTLRNQSKKVIFLMGPTASGKTSLAIELHKKIPVAIISVDSALIYRGMDIGTSKPSREDRINTPHKLLDIIDPAATYSVADFYRDALNAIDEIIASGKIPLLVGGTMLYFKTVLDGLFLLPQSDPVVRTNITRIAAKAGWPALHKKLLQIDPVSANRIHPNDKQRLLRALEVFFISGSTLTDLMKISGRKLPYQVCQFAIAPRTREMLHQLIQERFFHMLASGFQEEVVALFNRDDLNINMPSIRCIGYRQMWSYLVGDISYDEMIFRVICATNQLAKNQMTWLRSWKNIHWLDSEKPEDAIEIILQIISN